MTNDPKLELAMAKLLPQELIVEQDLILWKPTFESTDITDDVSFEEICIPIKETEWLYVMHLVWLTLDRKQRVAFSVHLREEVIKSGGHASSFNEDIIACCENATFNQRATAMCKVKGIEL